jgi:hypothetical protein
VGFISTQQGPEKSIEELNKVKDKILKWIIKIGAGNIRI